MSDFLKLVEEHDTLMDKMVREYDKVRDKLVETRLKTREGKDVLIDCLEVVCNLAAKTCRVHDRYCSEYDDGCPASLSGKKCADVVKEDWMSFMIYK